MPIVVRQTVDESYFFANLARDGQRLLLNVPLEDTTASLITVVVNWMPGSKK